MEEPFKKTYPAGRSIASLFAKLGWGIVLIGLLLAVVGLLRGATPGTGAPVEAVGLLARIASMGLGIGVGIFGLFSVMMAAQTRASMDTADLTREMLSLARNGAPEAAKSAALASPTPEPIVAERVKTPPSAIAAEPEPRPTVQDMPEPILDDVPPMPTILRPRPVTLSAGKPEPAPAKPEPSLRAEPSLGPRPKADAANAPIRKPHPIFSAKPPH